MNFWLRRLVFVPLIAVLVLPVIAIQPNVGSASAASCELLVNGGFESPTVSGSYQSFSDATVPGWSNMAEPAVEIWTDGFLGVPAYEGSQFAELNVNIPGNYYQDFAAEPGSTFSWEFAHRGRSGTETVVLEIGAPGGSLTVVTTATTGTSDWQVYAGTYTVPEGQTITRLAIRSISPSSGGVGNLIDGVSVQCGSAAVSTSGPVAGCTEYVDLPSTAVVGKLTDFALLYWMPNGPTNPAVYLDVGQSFWVDGIDETGMYRKLLLSCDWYWVEVDKVGPNYDDVWNGTPLPTHTTEFWPAAAD